MLGSWTMRLREGTSHFCTLLMIVRHNSLTHLFLMLTIENCVIHVKRWVPFAQFTIIGNSFLYTIGKVLGLCLYIHAHMSMTFDS